MSPTSAARPATASRASAASPPSPSPTRSTPTPCPSRCSGRRPPSTPSRSASGPRRSRNILIYGRAGTPMPAWGIKGGGPMNDQQIERPRRLPRRTSPSTRSEVKEDNLAAVRHRRPEALRGLLRPLPHRGFSYGEPGRRAAAPSGPSSPAAPPSASSRPSPSRSTGSPRRPPTASSTASGASARASCPTSRTCSPRSRSRPSSTTNGHCDGRLALVRSRGNPQVKGGLYVLLAVLILPGSVLPAPRHQHRAPVSGFQLAAAGLSGFLVILGATWWMYGIGPKGPAPTWRAGHRRQRRPGQVPARDPPGVPRRVGEARDRRSRGGRRPARRRRRAHQPR